MQEGRIRSATVFTAAVLAAGAICGPAGAAPLQGIREAANRMPSRVLVASASSRAASKLRTPECRAVLSDFQDAAGRRLSEILEERRLGADEFLSTLLFLDGRGTPQCASGKAAAVANPGSRYIGLCKETFAYVQATDPGLATNVVIHEMLHALGLGEDPRRRARRSPGRWRSAVAAESD